MIPRPAVYAAAMTRSLTIARIGETDVRVHPTFALVFLWVLIDWRRVGASNGAAAVIFTLVLVLLVFLCVLIHEFGHVFMARAFGVRVHDVSLSAIGGVSRMELHPGEPRSEMLIALAGPAANVAVIAALLPVLLLLGVLGGFSSLEEYARSVFSPSPTGLVSTLLYANLLIVVFNLLPAFPMDGGRALRAGLTTMLRREAATRTATIIGQALAVGLLLLAIFGIQSIILALLAVFIMVVAYAEDRAVRVESALQRLQVGQFALWDMGGIAPDQPLANALRGGPRDIVVTKDGRVLGMLWRNRLLAELANGASDRTVGDIMDRDVRAVDIDTSVFDVHRMMLAEQRWAVPVTEAGQYRGVFTADRFLHLYRQLTPDPARVMRDLLERRGFDKLRA
ncbi:MAG: site-2 protease family protein [Thermomicrobiales bacterium]